MPEVGQATRPKLQQKRAENRGALTGPSREDHLFSRSNAGSPKHNPSPFGTVRHLHKVVVVHTISAPSWSTENAYSRELGEKF
jgi:hypothetical protein